MKYFQIIKQGEDTLLIEKKSLTTSQQILFDAIVSDNERYEKDLQAYRSDPKHNDFPYTKGIEVGRRGLRTADKLINLDLISTENRNVRQTWAFLNYKSFRILTNPQPGKTEYAENELDPDVWQWRNSNGRWLELPPEKHNQYDDFANFKEENANYETRQVFKFIRAETVEEATGGWISCGDRLPDCECETLVFDQDGATAIFKYEPEEKYWDTAWYITHWMPLPEPPKS